MTYCCPSGSKTSRFYFIFLKTKENFSANNQTMFQYVHHFFQIIPINKQRRPVTCQTTTLTTVSGWYKISSPSLFSLFYVHITGFLLSFHPPHSLGLTFALNQNVPTASTSRTHFIPSTKQQDSNVTKPSKLYCYISTPTRVPIRFTAHFFHCPVQCIARHQHKHVQPIFNNYFPRTQIQCCNFGALCLVQHNLGDFSLNFLAFDIV